MLADKLVHFRRVMVVVVTGGDDRRDEKVSIQRFWSSAGWAAQARENSGHFIICNITFFTSNVPFTKLETIKKSAWKK